MAQTYTVKKGETLSQIGKKLGVDWHKITGYRSGNPNLIYPGEVLSIPGTGTVSFPTQKELEAKYPPSKETVPFPTQKELEKKYPAPTPKKKYTPYVAPTPKVPIETEWSDLFQETKSQAEREGWGWMWIGLGSDKRYYRKENGSWVQKSSEAEAKGYYLTKPTKWKDKPEGEKVVGDLISFLNRKGLSDSQLDKISDDMIASSTLAEAQSKAQSYMNKYKSTTTTIPKGAQQILTPKQQLDITKGTTQLPAPTVDPNKQARDDAADKVNEDAQTIFDNIPTGDDIDLRDSTKILADIQTKLKETEEKIPAPVSMVDLFESKKAELGIEALDTELAGIDSEIEAINAELFVQMEEAGEVPVSTREIGRAKGALQKRAEREIFLLQTERNAVARQLSNKYSSLEMVMNLTQQDFANTSAYYTQQYNRQIQLFNILSDVEEKEYTRAEDAQKDAQINLQVITKAMVDSGKTWDDLDASLQTKITNLELQAELPIGITEAFYNEYPDEEVVFEQKGTDASGKEFVSFISKDKEGNYSVKNVYTGAVAEAEEAEKAEIKFSSDDVGRLTAVGLSPTEVTDMQSHLNAGGTIAGITGLTDEQSTALDQILTGVTPSQVTKGEEEEVKKKDEEALLTQRMKEYKDYWSRLGDKGAGTREEFIADMAGETDHLSYDEIASIVYKEVSDEWLKKNKPGWIKRKWEGRK